MKPQNSRLKKRVHTRPHLAIMGALALCLLWQFAATATLADGCFVFRWNKQADINEPSQKAIIVYDAGREDMLLQVKYQGPLKEFGWLIPVPSLPKVEMGSMNAFYELSQLTQRAFGDNPETLYMGLPGAGEKGRKQPVEVIETKTVGAYEVTVLSANDAGSLSRWLKWHGYSIPEEKSGIIDEYINKAWYFVAAKIQLNQKVAFKMETSGIAKSSPLTKPARKSVGSKLAAGELHPLRISFDTPKCIFPLKISAVGGKPSEVSLYVLSARPLLNKFIFDEACQKLEVRRAQWERERPIREKNRQICMNNLSSLNLSFMLLASEGDKLSKARVEDGRDWSNTELESMVTEVFPPPRSNSLEEKFEAQAQNIHPCLPAGTEILRKTARSLPRLQGKNWFLTKQVRTFAPSEMRDLEFVPALPELAKVLARPAGPAAAAAFAKLGPRSFSFVNAASQSPSVEERMNAVLYFGRVKDSRAVEPLLRLLADDSPQVRFHAIRAAGVNWDRRFIDAHVALFRDPNQEIRNEAVLYLATREGRDRIPYYLHLLQDPDLNVRLCALEVLRTINPNAIPREPLIEMLRDPNPDVQFASLRVISQLKRSIVTRAEVVPFLNVPQKNVYEMALHLILGARPGSLFEPPPAPSFGEQTEPQPERSLSSNEAAYLITNRVSFARIIGLKYLAKNADARAVELGLPLLQDKNPIVRRRAFAVMKTVTGQNLSPTDSKIWEAWWAANKTNFHSGNPK